MQTIALSQLALALIPAALVAFILWRWTDEASTSAYAISRMVLQLVAIGYVLTFIFETEHASLVLLTLSIMLLVSSWIALRPIPLLRSSLYFRALAATSIVNVALLTLITQLILETDPWFSPNVVIPLAGMVFAVGMNSISLFAERFISESKGKSSIEARNTAFRATLIPITNSLFAVGLVSLPGMMTGQILSGVSPHIAVRYQILIMLMLFSSTGLTAFVFYCLFPKSMKS